MSGDVSKLIAFNYFGGKFSWLEELYENFPSTMVHLVDVFGGSFSVSLNFKRPIIKTANELNSDITNFFRILRERPYELLYALELTPCSKAEFDNCWEKSDDDLENARRFYVRVRQSFFGLGAQRRNKGWHMARQHSNASGGETVSKWNNALDKLIEVALVIRENYQIVNFDYSECISKLDAPGVFFYCDPPYSKRSRASFNDYKFEFSDEQHEALSEQLHSIEGLAMISGYDCSLMNHLYSDWRKVKFKSKKNNIRSGEVQEVIWMNYDHKPLDLFHGY